MSTIDFNEDNKMRTMHQDGPTPRESVIPQQSSALPEIKQRKFTGKVKEINTSPRNIDQAPAVSNSQTESIEDSGMQKLLKYQSNQEQEGLELPNIAALKFNDETRAPDVSQTSNKKPYKSTESNLVKFSDPTGLESKKYKKVAPMKTENKPRDSRRKSVEIAQEDESSDDSAGSADSEEAFLIKSGMQKSLYLDEYQDPATFEKLVKVTNIGQDGDELDDDSEMKMKDLKSAILTLDNQNIITLEQDNDQEAYIRSYILNEDGVGKQKHLEMVKSKQIDENVSVKSMDSEKRRQHQWSINLKDKTFLKIDTIQQNEDGTKFAVVYQDNGKFYLIMFDKKGKKCFDDFYINEKIGIDDSSVGMKVCTTPLIVTSQFLPDDLIFINMYHKKERCQYHCLFNYNINRIVKTGKHQFGKDSHSSEMNYPIGTFYLQLSENDLNIYCFYRQGMVIEIDYMDNSLEHGCKDYQLMPREIDTIFFTKLRVDPENPKSSQLQFFICLYNSAVHFYTWNMHGDLVKYHTMPSNDDAALELVQISYTPGDYRFQLILEKKIKIFKLETKGDKFFPVLENTLYNFMKCSQLLLSKNGEFAVSFKHDQDNLYVYERKYMHSFTVQVDNQNYEGSVAKTLKNGCFILGHGQVIQLYNSKKEVRCTIEVDDIAPDESIISMDLSRDDKRLGVGFGKVVRGADESITKMVIFDIKKQRNQEGKKVLLIEEIIRQDTSFDTDISIEFEFSDDNFEELILFSKVAILRFNYMTDTLITQKDGRRRTSLTRLFGMKGLLSQPDFISFNKNQTKAIIGSEESLVFKNLKLNEQIDLARKYDFEDIKSVIHDPQSNRFFILVNKMNDNNGFFLMSFHEDTLNLVHHISWEHKLPMADADMSLMQIKLTSQDHRHIVCSFKCQFINTYNIFVINITTNDVEFWHESYALFEAEMTGFHCADNDFMILNRFGMYLITMKNDLKPKKVRSSGGNKLKLHSMGSLNYLKIRESNHIRIMDAGEDTIISIQDQFMDTLGKNEFIDLYRVKLYKQTLRELLFIQSLIGAPSEIDVFNLVKEQPSPSLLYEAYLELDKRSLVTYLVRQKKTIDYLLGDANQKFFSIKYPIFYMNPDGNSAIDIALSNNLIRPISRVIDYVVQYQNSPVFSKLFQNNFLHLLKRSIKVAHVLDSHIFKTPLDFSDWPHQSEYNTKVMKPYNDSDIHMQNKYQEIFPQMAEYDIRPSSILKHSAKNENKKVLLYKIKYTLNRLPTFSTEKKYLIDALVKTQEDDVFRTQVVKDFTQYHWNCYGKYPILAGFFNHAIYIVFMAIYIDYYYQQKKPFDDCKLYLFLMLFPLIFATIYDLKQFQSKPRKYFSQVANRVDVIFIVLSYLNLAVQYFVGREQLWQKIIYILVVTISTQKIFLYIRVFENLSYIVTMLEHVTMSILGFLLFYGILVFMMQQGMSIAESSIAASEASQDYPQLSSFSQRFIVSLKLSLGQLTNGSKGLNQMEMAEANTFFVVRIFSLLIANIIYQKFIIGQIMATFNKIRTTIDVQMVRQRLNLIKESHDVLGRRTTNKNWFPKFMVIREQET